jgi:hypothetical protein
MRDVDRQGALYGQMQELSNATILITQVPDLTDVLLRGINLTSIDKLIIKTHLY